MKTIELRTCDHPERNGRTPKPGEKGYTLVFPLEDGLEDAELRLQVGEETMYRFATMIGQMMIDDAAEAEAEPAAED